MFKLIHTKGEDKMGDYANQENLRYLAEMVSKLKEENQALTAERDLLKKVVRKHISSRSSVNICINTGCGADNNCIKNRTICGSDACIELHKEQAREGK